ncbi:MAG: hypothetical protein VKJ04_02780 [Vampirovibrionales bacterium]|nr:hypothetical protein [Vampirovibrionales bacterium]
MILYFSQKSLQASRLWKRPLGLGLSASLLVGALGLFFPQVSTPQALAWGKKKQEQSIRDFLPPVALINDAISIEQLKKREKADSAVESELGPIVFSAVSPATVKLSSRPASLQGSINLHEGNQEFETLVDLQKKLDEKDLKHLWEATVEQNPVIRFSLEKLAMPIDLQPRHSSNFLNKTLAVMINGAAMGAMMMAPGAGAYQNMGIATVSQAAQNVVMGNNKPQTSTLTATEQIQLAGLIDDLKAELIQNYQGYKKVLEQLTQARAVTLRNNNLYASALRINNPLSKMAAGSAYYKAVLNETELRQQAMMYRLKLERLAGRPAIDKLQLSLAVPTEAAIEEVKASDNSKTAVSAKISGTEQAKTVPEDGSLIGPLPLEQTFSQSVQAPVAPLQNTAFLKKNPAVPLEPSASISPKSFHP